MKTYHLMIEMVSPVMISANRGTGHLLQGTDYVPGTSLRGAIAALFNEKEFVEGEIAHEIFVKEKVSFGSLYFCDESGNPCRPLPMSAVSCKFGGGFAAEGFHGIKDLLLDDPAGALPSCPYPDCGASVKHPGGYYSGEREGSYRMKSPFKRRIAHTAISISRQVATPGRLYTYEAMDPFRKPMDSVAQSFGGFLKTGDEELIRAIKERLEQTNMVLNVGKAISRGYGKTNVVELPKSEFVPHRMDISERLDGLNGRIKKRGSFFSLTLLSDAVILDPLLRYRSFIDPSDLAVATGVDLFTGYKLVRWFSSPAVVRGWNRKTGLPRRDEMAIGKGACFLYFGEEESLMDEILHPLKQMESVGIGERLCEGFGRVAVSDPFHWQEDWK